MHDDSLVATASHVRRQVPALQADLHHAGADAWAAGRTAGRQALERELGAEISTSFAGVAIADAAAATSAAALAARWGSTALATILAVEHDEGSGEHSVAKSLSRVGTEIDGSVRRTAATETARAFNDERNTALVILGGGDEGHARHRDRDALAPGMFKVWSAVLDARTCATCWGADGQVVEAHAAFKAGLPPLHPNCRCVIEHVIVPKPERLEDIGIDYELFKEELRDVIREGRAISDRHALGFVSDSLGPGNKRSPLALTKRFANEPYATTRISSGLGSGGGGGGGSSGGGSGGGGKGPHPAHVRLGISTTLTPARDRSKESRAHSLTGREARRELTRGGPAFVFHENVNLDDLEAAVWAHGTPQPTLRGHERISLLFDAPIGVRKQVGQPDRPLDVVEIKGKMRENQWVYHLVPREKPAK